MCAATVLPWQPSLLDANRQPEPDEAFSTLMRRRLDPTAWVDHAAGWLTGADALFVWLIENAPWHGGELVIHGKSVVQPRLMAHWGVASALPPPLERMRAVLSRRYRCEFDSVGANLYRDGRDSVAWHGDRIPRTVHDPLVAIVTLGQPRRFLLRPRGGRTQLTLVPQAGDLVVMGGTSQRTWEHCIPKVVSAAPRISVSFRHSTNSDDPVNN